MTKNMQVTHIQLTDIEVLGEHTRYTLLEICEREKVPADLIIELISYGIAEPDEAAALTQSPTSWQFSPDQFFRIRRALRLKNDLGINLPGLALTADLMDELEALRLILQNQT